MATLTKRGNGLREIQFKGLDGKRKCIRLGRVPLKHAKDVKRRIESILSARMMGQVPDQQTAAWLMSISETLRERMIATGLASPQIATTLDGLLSSYSDGRDIQESTKENIEQVSKNLLRFFGASRQIRSITPGDADDFREWLAVSGGENSRNLAASTASRRCGRAKSIFHYARKKRWIDENPFGHIKSWASANRDRDYFVPAKASSEILDAITDIEFRSIFALARYGGLRSPSEIIHFQWDWVDWANDCIRVRSPKNRRHSKKYIRNVPLFPELNLHLRELHEEAADGQHLLFPFHQVSGAALTKKLDSACRSTGITLWRKPWQNLRSTRETELLDVFPTSVVVAWMGHSERVSREHYSQITKEHHARAVALGASPADPQKSAVKSAVS